MNTETEDPNMPDEWPAGLDLFLRGLSGANRREKRERLRRCLADGLRARFPGATDSDVRAAFAALEKDGLANPDEWQALAAQYDAWWSTQRAATNRRNRYDDKGGKNWKNGT